MSRMMNLIDKDKIISDLQKVLGITDWQIEKGGINAGIIDSVNPIIGGFLQYILDQPTIDAVEVVRCKDCKYGITYGIIDGFVLCSKPYTERGNAMHRTYWFCADGEVKSDGN